MTDQKIAAISTAGVNTAQSIVGIAANQTATDVRQRVLPGGVRRVPASVVTDA